MLRDSKNGSIMLWVLVVLFVLSMMLVAYARIVNIDYNISLSVFRQQSANQNAYAGLAVVRNYYKLYPSQLINSFTNLGNDEAEELYPSGTLIDQDSESLLYEYNVENLYLERDHEGVLYIYTEAKYQSAKTKLRVKVLDADNGLYGDIERLR